MLNLKRMVCMLLTAGMFTTALPVQALAASDYQYITNISLKVEVDLDAGDEVNSGDSVGTSKDDSGTKVYTTSDKYSVESAEWTNNKDVSIGDTPKITVWLEPDSSSSSKYEYRFRSSYGSSKVSISGGEFVSCSKSGSSLKVVLRVNGVKGTYEAPKEAEWGSGKGKATWKAPDDKTGYYDVILYKGSTVMKEIIPLKYVLFLIQMSRSAMVRRVNGPSQTASILMKMMYQMALDRTTVPMEVTAVVSPLEAVLRMLAGNRITTTGILNTRMAIM